MLTSMPPTGFGVFRWRLKLNPTVPKSLNCGPNSFMNNSKISAPFTHVLVSEDFEYRLVVELLDDEIDFGDLLHPGQLIIFFESLNPMVAVSLLNLTVLFASDDVIPEAGFLDRGDQRFNLFGVGRVPFHISKRIGSDFFKVDLHVRILLPCKRTIPC